MFPDVCPGYHTCRDVLALLRLGHCFIGQISEQGVIQGQTGRDKGMDNLLALVAVKESPDFADVSDMVLVAGRLREHVYVGTMIRYMSNTAPKCLTTEAGAINDSTTFTPSRAIFDNCCRDPISSTPVLPSFSFRKLLRIQVRMSWQHVSSLPMVSSTLV